MVTLAIAVVLAAAQAELAADLGDNRAVVQVEPTLGAADALGPGAPQLTGASSAVHSCSPVSAGIRSQVHLRSLVSCKVEADMAKKKLIVPKAASADALKLAVELIEVAETDLAAALTLHRASHYPQAVFYLQQSVEKIGKAYGLGMGIVEPNQLQTEWSHNTLKHSEVFADYREQEGLVGPGMAPDKIKAFINELKDPGKMKGPAKRSIVAWVLSLVTQHNELKSDPVRRQKELADMTAWAVGKRTDPAAVAKATAFAEFLVDWTSAIALIMPTTIVLGMATAPHAVIARYPTKTTKPVKLYRPDYPVVQALPQLSVVCSALLKAVRELCALAGRLPMILAMSGGDVTEGSD